MKKYGTLLLFLSIIMFVLVACTGTTDNGTQSDEKSKEETTTQEKSKKKEVKNLTLPDGFPTDFPIPDEFKITDVSDQSDSEQNNYTIRFDFDPSIDLEPIFKLYDDYSEKLGYNILLGGEPFFAKGIFQYGAHDPKSASNMFVITLKEDGSFGSIDYRAVK